MIGRNFSLEEWNCSIMNVNDSAYFFTDKTLMIGRNFSLEESNCSIVNVN